MDVTIAPPASCTAFAESQQIATGDIYAVAREVKQQLDAGESRTLHIFEDATGKPVEIDFRGTIDDVLGRLSQRFSSPDDLPAPAEEAPRGPGRPKLGVVGREVTLLPRHWEWLATQPGGASVTLRKLVEDARRERREADEVRQAKDATYRFMTALAGDLPGYEEATRALYAADEGRFSILIQPWPTDLAGHAKRLAARVWA